ncbi:MAG: DUF86 domain-containing protein [Anaerolineae bacterium]
MAKLEKIEGIFRNLDRYVAILRDLAAMPKEALLADPVRLGGARYYLQVAVECCIDVANHLIAQAGWRPPRNYADSFVVLAENGVLPEDFLVTARRMVGMRNRLVHLYWEVDDEMVYRTLREHLDDFDRFQAAIYAYLQRSALFDQADGENA